MGFIGKLTQPGTSQHLAEHCRDDWCPRLPCRMWKAGYERGYEDARLAGDYASGYSEGYKAAAADAASGSG
jgi:hypothetical protein